MEVQVKAVDGEVDMAGIHTQQATTPCHHSQRSRAQWGLNKGDISFMMINDNGET